MESKNRLSISFSLFAHLGNASQGHDCCCWYTVTAVSTEESASPDLGGRRGEGEEEREETRFPNCFFFRRVHCSKRARWPSTPPHFLFPQRALEKAFASSLFFVAGTTLDSSSLPSHSSMHMRDSFQEDAKRKESEVKVEEESPSSLKRRQRRRRRRSKPSAAAAPSSFSPLCAALSCSPPAFLSTREIVTFRVVANRNRRN